MYRALRRLTPGYLYVLQSSVYVENKTWLKGNEIPASTSRYLEHKYLTVNDACVHVKS
jgi:hypothetical protein